MVPVIAVNILLGEQNISVDDIRGAGRVSTIVFVR